MDNSSILTLRELLEIMTANDNLAAEGAIDAARATAANQEFINEYLNHLAKLTGG